MKFTLGSIFTDHMVLQQQTPVCVWGTADPGAQVTVSFGDQHAEAKADGGGHWKAVLRPMPASAEPAEMKATDGKSEATCWDVLVGEVWLCSGQSNMAWAVATSADAEKEIAAADFPAIRLLTVPRYTSTERETEIAGPGVLHRVMPGGKPAGESPKVAWAVCSPETVSSFSAAGYFFGRELHRRLGVPVGLINSSVGGTPAESWISREGLLVDPAVRDIWESYERGLPASEKRRAECRREMEEIEARTRDVANVGFGLGFAGMADPEEGWKTMMLPGKWQSRGLLFSGILWFRKVVDIPPEWEGKDLRLSIGAADKSDITYFNGEQVGSVTMAQREDAWCFSRVYPVQGKLVKAGRNVIAVRVHSNMTDAGMTGPEEAMSLSCPEMPEAPAISLAGGWRYEVEANYGAVQIPSEPLGPGNNSTPTLLFNAMIAPFAECALRGVIWYQGESNVGRAEQYKALFPALIRDWRRQLGNEKLAFHFVQLCGYAAACEQPEESARAELREAQAEALRLPGTGMAVTIDIGEADNIHPRNKQDVGLRLAFSALRGTYGRTDVAACGPVFRSARAEGNSIRVCFEPMDGALVCRGEKLEGFAIAGADRVFVWADARIEGEAVVLANRSIYEPRHVRYAWAENPVCNLYNAAGLPAAPFQAGAAVAT